ncbi:putative coiled-coil domain-containing protein 195 [Scyliorhinus canicula]|uniref:putative coiled-coil domain-containing protein 195 n=1 Tax=Scyliorhinus canicula TaxID=7830 RepID=UPI0018F3A6E2|nr:putative coiled-coil domain-containing protein 195 [Scyliorhinus canicula]
MDSNKRLMQIIGEMRSDMKKLESENKALRVKLSQSGRRAEILEKATISALQQQLKTEEVLTHANLRRNISAPELEGDGRDNAMTVRRYSISSLHAFTVGNKHQKSLDQTPTYRKSEQEEPRSTAPTQPCTITKLAKSQGILAQLPDANTSEENYPQRASLKEYVHKCKFKMKSVTFLLPVDAASHPEKECSSQHPGDQNYNQLSTILENDS